MLIPLQFQLLGDIGFSVGSLYRLMAPLGWVCLQGLVDHPVSSSYTSGFGLHLFSVNAMLASHLFANLSFLLVATYPIQELG